MLEEAKKRDHKKLGKELELFTFSQKVGAGLPIWLPKGTAIRERLERFMRQAQIERGYVPVVTPHIGKKELYVTSGHYEKYGEDSFQPIKTPNEDEEFLLKPMNCPHHCEIYKFKPHSYKDLPLRVAEFGTVYRYEQSGELNGLARVRGFTQDDAHIFCTQDQIKSEFIDVIDLVMYVFKKLGFEEFTAQISLRDKEDRSKYIGSDENWEKAEQAIIEAASERDLKTVTEYGEAAFYGPKLDFMVKDAIGRKWQLGTIQVDYNLPERFELEYVGSDNQKHRPVMIHRAPFGSLERFIGILIEHCAGDFPLWLSPEQITVLSISEKFNGYAEKVLKYLNNHDIRGFVDDRNEKIGKKIRDAEVSKIPFMLIVGEKEAENQQISVRKHKEGDRGTMSLDEFVGYFKNLLVDQNFLKRVRAKGPRTRKKALHRINDYIKEDPIRLVGDGEPKIVPLAQAKSMASEQELDLVEISPNAKPPVCKILDYNKFLYEQKKKQKEMKAKQQKTVVKEIRFGPNTDDHDIEFKRKHAEKFLNEGNKVRAYVFFRGRTIVHKERGELLLLQFAEKLQEIAKLEQMPKMEGKKMIIMLAPKK